MKSDVVNKKKVRFSSKDDYVAEVIDEVAARDRVEIIGKVEEVDIRSNHDAGDISHSDLDHIDNSDRTVLSPKEVIEVGETNEGLERDLREEILDDEADKNIVMPELLDDTSDDEDESWDARARYGRIQGRDHPNQISLRVEYDEKEAVIDGTIMRASVRSDNVMSNVMLEEAEVMRRQHEQGEDNQSEKMKLETILEDENESDDTNSDSSIADGRRVGILGSQRTGKIITVALSTPIESKSVTSVPLIHAVVIYPKKRDGIRRTRSKEWKKKKDDQEGLKINSIECDQNNMEMNRLRAAFPEPNPAAFDNSIYVDVAMQAMSAEELNDDYSMMTPRVYEEMRRSYQIDGGASLTAISESKAIELKCKMIKRREFQIMVAVANGDKMRSLYYTPLKLTFRGVNDSGEPVMKTVMIIANVVPNLSGGIIIGSDVMKALRITIPYNEENTATLRVQGERLTFKYNTTEQVRNPVIKKTYVVTKSERIPMSATKSFNSLFYGIDTMMVEGDRYQMEK